MVIILHELKWLPLLSHAKAEKKISARPRLLSWRKKWRKTFLSSKANWQTASQTKKRTRPSRKVRMPWTQLELRIVQPPKYAKNGKICIRKQRWSSQCYRRSRKKTNGGPASKMLSAAVAEIIDLFKDTPYFTVLDSFESKGKDFSLSLIFFWCCLRYI